MEKSFMEDFSLQASQLFSLVSFPDPIPSFSVLHTK